MSSILYQASIITLLLLPFLSFSTADDRIFDSRGDPLDTGSDYYIIPTVDDYEGYLGYNPKKHNSCPPYIKYTYTRTPLQISNPSNTQFINLDERVSIAIINGSNACKQSLVWRRTLNPLARKEYITTGGVKEDWSFSITAHTKNRSPFYVLKYWPSGEGVGSANVGLYDDNGLLGITESPTTVFFERVSPLPEVSTA